MASKDHSSNHDEFESEETVSLCDLPVYGYETDYSTAACEEYSMEEDESFEFFSQEWLENPKDLNFFPNKDSLFGEFNENFIIPRKPILKNTQDFKKLDQEFKKLNQEFKKLNQDSDSCRKSESLKLPTANKGGNHGGKQEMKRVFPVMKSRWYYYGFGLAGIPTEMDLRAIKSRQNRQRKSEAVGGGGGRKEEAEEGGFRRKGLRRLIRDLSCDGKSQANSMVKASLVYIPRV